jgi:hypothetical protein
VSAGLDSSAYGTHSMRRTKAAQIYKKTRGPNRSSHWKIRPLRSATIIALCIGCTYPPGDWDGVRKNEVTGSNSYSKMVARYRQDLLAVHAAWPATVKD